jgi:hypothetical protein
VLQATISGGAVSAVTVLNGGQGYSSSVSIVENTNFTEGEKFKRPQFKYSELENVAEIYNRDIENVKKLARDGEDTEGAIGDLAAQRFISKTALQAQQIARDVWYGSPASQTADIWSNQFGLLAAVDDGSTTTNYAGIDRTMAANYWARAIVDTGAKNWGVADLVDDALLGKGLATKGGGIDCFLVPMALMQKFRRENNAIIQKVDNDDRIREMAQYGFKAQVVKYGETYIIADPLCPPKTCIGLNLKSWILNFLPGKKFTPSTMYDQKGIPGGIDGYRFFINTQWRFICRAPNLNVKYTNVT